MVTTGRVKMRSYRKSASEKVVGAVKGQERGREDEGKIGKHRM